ncbi:MAG: N-acetylmuramoyl-L-alanine amidase, partial [Duncaniella sp.]|nr:N-acetylmuramoyl-L-alanine amidase [Duncaniella sp.]
GYNARSIGICNIGGLEARDTNGTMNKDTRTREQKASLIRLIKDIKARYKTIRKVMGHRDTSPDLNGNGIIEPYEFIKGCPCFDAISEYKNI